MDMFQVRSLVFFISLFPHADFVLPGLWKSLRGYVPGGGVGPQISQIRYGVLLMDKAVDLAVGVFYIAEEAGFPHAGLHANGLYPPLNSVRAQVALKGRPGYRVATPCPIRASYYASTTANALFLIDTHYSRGLVLLRGFSRTDRDTRGVATLHTYSGEAVDPGVGKLTVGSHSENLRPEETQRDTMVHLAGYSARMAEDALFQVNN